jgi:hypothetical protein
MIKFIDWAYPTSQHAKEFGREDAGCWLAKTREEGTETLVDHFDTREEAAACLEKINCAWSPC